MPAAIYARAEPQILTAQTSSSEILEIDLTTLIGSLPDRLKAVGRNKGDTVPYGGILYTNIFALSRSNAV